jgi:hypothetical protein
MKNVYLFGDDWLESVKKAKNSWAFSVLENINGSGDVYLKCISKWYAELPGTNKQKNHLKKSLESVNNPDHLGAVNELSWWSFCKLLEFEIERIPEGASRRPDFKIKLQNLSVLFEVTTLNPSDDESCCEINYSQEKSIKRTIRKVAEKTGQFEYGYIEGIPTVLVLFNYNEWSGLGTQFHRKIGISNLFCESFLGLSAIIYIERFVINGKPKLKKDSIVIADNTNAKYPLPEIVKKTLISAVGGKNWIDCDNF